MGEHPIQSSDNSAAPEGGQQPGNQPQPENQQPEQFAAQPGGLPPPFAQPPFYPPPFAQPGDQQGPYPQSPHNQPYPPYGAPALKQDTTNTMAIVAFVLSFVVNLAGVITGHIALGQIKRTGEKGRGFALAGVIIGYVSLAASVAAAIILVVVLAAGGLAASGVTSYDPDAESARPNGTVEQVNTNAYGGITFGRDGVLIPPTVLTADVDIWDLPKEPANLADIGIKASASGEPVQVVVYLDFMCPDCADFEEEYGPSLRALGDQGGITLEYRPGGFLDEYSDGADYSSRAAEAAACVANTAPEDYKRFIDTLLANQPAIDSMMPDTNYLVELANAVGAGDIDDCLAGMDMFDLVSGATRLAVGHGLTGIPGVFMDGKQWMDGPFPDFAQGVLDAKQ